MILSPEQKIAGVLTPLFAIRTETDLGIGDLDGLRQFIDWAASVGFKLVQLLPINETGGDNSPYNAISAMAIEPMTLHLAPGSPEDLTQDDFDEVVGGYNLKKLRAGSVHYEKVRKLKRALLEKAFARYRARRENDAAVIAEFDEFCAKENAWLHDYVFFRALMEENGGTEAYDYWRDEHRSIPAARAWLMEQPDEVRQRFEEREFFFRYVQWIAYAQWMAAKAYADERDVALMGDIPFGVSYYSADVFARPDQFLLEWSGGAPPEPYFKDDEFTQKWGQNWGIPLYNWGAMRATNFDWWRQRVRGVRRIFHVFRIDHVLGFYRIYAFPWRPQRNAEFLPLNQEEMLQRTGGRAPHYAPRDDDQWEHCEANRREGEDYLRMALEAAESTRLVGEDLGTVPPYVRPSLQSLGIAGFKIPQWENTPEGRVIPGRDYQRLSVTTYATHDHKPLRAMWDEAFEHESATREQALGDLRKIAEFAGVASLSDAADFDRDFYEPTTRALFESEAWMAIVMITDLLARKDRFNVPGTASDSNWSRRLHMTMARLGHSRGVKQRMRLVRRLLEASGRA
ncbi:MAG: GH77 [uncultured Chthoniobacterales bacterium]|uniref:4-alpha-glucanotransferase n=1 Tax=uncultured Chthoniobacterales bacterium TaxID=1836801 RepID=A0A6J4IJA3_9BACT|nr:MAG: GH77 [uncultured Chthoniobacterales bacterium]